MQKCALVRIDTWLKGKLQLIPNSLADAVSSLPRLINISGCHDAQLHVLFRVQCHGAAHRTHAQSRALRQYPIGKSHRDCKHHRGVRDKYSERRLHQGQSHCWNSYVVWVIRSIPLLGAQGVDIPGSLAFFNRNFK